MVAMGQFMSDLKLKSSKDLLKLKILIRVHFGREEENENGK